MLENYCELCLNNGIYTDKKFTPNIITIIYVLKKSIKLSLFWIGVVVGLPKSSLDPFLTLISKNTGAS